MYAGGIAISYRNVCMPRSMPLQGMMGGPAFQFASRWESIGWMSVSNMAHISPQNDPYCTIISPILRGKMGEIRNPSVRNCK